MTGPLVLLAPNAPIAAAVTAAVHPTQAASEAFVVVVAEGPAPTAVARARAAHGSVPLGFVVESEADAVEALAAGADEAMVLPVIDGSSLAVLAERARARATQRIAHASELDDAAHAEKLAALGTVVAGVAHEINNPLTAMMLAVDVFKTSLGPLFDAADELQRAAAADRALSPDEVSRLAASTRTGARVRDTRELLEEAAAHVRTIAEIVRDLRIFARAADDEAPQVVHVPELVDHVLRIVGRQIAPLGHVERDYSNDLPRVLVPHSRVVQVLTNILINASHAIAEVDRAVHRVRITIRADADYLAISVADTGPGIPRGALERIFDPFYTTKAVGHGTGLGLSISRALMRRLGGDLLVESVHGEGATFIALVPLPDAESLRAAIRRSSGEVRAGAAPGRRATVLVIDDDDRLLRAYPRILRESYEVIVASDGQEAIDLLESGSTADAVMTDLVMPEMDGRRFFAWLQEHRPELARRTVFVTAATSEADTEFLARLRNPVVTKPATRAQLLNALDEALRDAS